MRRSIESVIESWATKDASRPLLIRGARRVGKTYAAEEIGRRIAGDAFVKLDFQTDLELISRRIIRDFEGDPDKNLEKYATTGSTEYQRLVDEIKNRFGLTSLKFNTIETLVKAIGLPKCKVCTHCFDGSSCF